MEIKEQEAEINQKLVNHCTKNAILLKELIFEINKYLSQNKQEISSLADILKKIFYSDLTCILNVSK